MQRYHSENYKISHSLTRTRNTRKFKSNIRRTLNCTERVEIWTPYDCVFPLHVNVKRLIRVICDEFVKRLHVVSVRNVERSTGQMCWSNNCRSVVKFILPSVINVSCYVSVIQLCRLLLRCEILTEGTNTLKFVYLWYATQTNV